MDIFVLNKSLEKIAVIDTYVSLIWTKRYYSAGDFELFLPASSEMFGVLCEDNYLQRADDETIMIIENIELQTDAESGNFIIVSGRSLESILARRIVWTQTNLNGTAETEIMRVISENCIAPTIPARAISRLQLATANGYTETISQQITGDNIATWLESICTAYGWGWKITLSDGAFVFEIYKGADRTYSNTEGNPFVVFSPEFDNLVNSNYQYSKQNFKNVALIAGEGEGTSRTRASIGSAEDLDRYELYIDAKDISSNNGEIDAAAYETMLLERGAQKIAEHLTTAAFDGEIDAEGVYIYKKDFDIGDIVQIENEYGIAATARIIEIIDSEDESGRRVVPTLEKYIL